MGEVLPVAVAARLSTELGGCDRGSRPTILSLQVNHKTSEWECDRARTGADATLGQIKGPLPFRGEGECFWWCRGEM